MTPMPIDYMKVIQESRDELRQLIRQRCTIENRITQLTIALRSLARLLPNETEREKLHEELKGVRRKAPSLVEAISDALRDADKSLTSNQIREELENNGFDLSEYSQPLGVIMTTLKRLVDSGRVKRSKGTPVNFKWIGPPRDLI